MTQRTPSVGFLTSNALSRVSVPAAPAEPKVPQSALREMVERGRTLDKTVGIDGDEMEAWLDRGDFSAPLPSPKKIAP